MEHNGLTNNADEELTSLTWLHDKNLLKGKHSKIRKEMKGFKL